MAQRREVVSVSLGSPHRDKEVEWELLGVPVRMRRMGVDGDLARGVKLIRELDGRVDAIGLGGIDLYLHVGRRRYVLRDGVRLARAARTTPVVDGSGLKQTLERRVVRQMVAEGRVTVRDQPVLMLSSVDRYGMAAALAQEGAALYLADLMMIGIPYMLTDLRQLAWAAMLLGPIVFRLPVSMLYPVGENQRRELPPNRRLLSYYQRCRIVAGDFHLIRRTLPARLAGQTVLTNTTTPDDLAELARRGVGLVVTTTPEMDGRSFGTNVLEAALVAVSGAGRPLRSEEYEALLEELQIGPRYWQP